MFVRNPFWIVTSFGFAYVQFDVRFALGKSDKILWMLPFDVLKLSHIELQKNQSILGSFSQFWSWFSDVLLVS